MSKKRKVLTEAEIWDDSELIDSWNDALEEYNYYHSLHARGEKVEQVLRRAEAAELEPGDEQTPIQDQAEDGELNYSAMDEDDGGEGSEGEIIETPMGVKAAAPPNGYASGTKAQNSDGMSKKDISEPVQHQKSEAGPQHVSDPGVAAPQALMAGVQDEALKNLMMSWYYAGYYTGFYQGQQQQAQAQAQKQAPG